MRGILWAVLRSPLAVLPIFDQGQPHHITLFYDVDKTQYKHLISTEFEATAIANLWNNDIQALSMLMPDNIPHKTNPHITVSYRDGIAPAASNDLFKCDDDRVIAPYSQKLNFKIEFFLLRAGHPYFWMTFLFNKSIKRKILWNEYDLPDGE
jgi:hypothetical protein